MAKDTQKKAQEVKAAETLIKSRHKLSETIEELLTSNPESPFNLAKTLAEEKVELLTVESMRPELEDAIVRTTMNLLTSDKVAARDKLGAIDRAANLTGLSQQAPTLINTGNMQVNQLSAGASRHLLGAGKALKTLSSARLKDINISQSEVEDVETD